MVANAVKPSTIAKRFSDERRLRPLSVDQYLEMVRLGIISEDDNVELIEGWLVEKMGKNGPHNVAQMLLNRWLSRILPDTWALGIETPIRTTVSIPEPDLSIVRGSPRDYIGQPPHAEEIGLLIEISDTTLRSDRLEKLQLYAAATIVQYWILNVSARQIEVYTEPQPDTERPTYATKTIYGESDTITLILDGQAIAEIKVSDLLP